MVFLFYLLDITYEVIDNSPEIRLWGVNEKGEDILVIDRKYKPSFFIIPSKGVTPENLKESILKKAGNIIGEISIERKRYIGQELEVLKVTPLSPNHVASIIKKIKKLNGIQNIFEDDIRYSNQYLLEGGVIPCSWHEMEGEEIPRPEGIDVKKVYLLKKRPVVSERIEYPELRILAFSIVCYSPIGTANPDINPVIILSAATNDGRSFQFVADNGDNINDGPIIKDFSKLVRDFSPHIIMGFGSNTRDINYLVRRAKINNLTLSIDRAGGEPHPSLYGHMSVTGRAHVDLRDLAEDLQEIKLKRLRDMGEFLGLKEAREGIWVEDHEISSYWDDPDKRSLLIGASRRDASLILRIGSLMLSYAMELSSLVGIPLDHVCTAAFGFRVEAYLMKQAKIYNEIIPKRIERPYIPYVGGMVLPPKPGIHRDIAVLDFRSMYPNLMILYNISPDTYVKRPEPGMEYYRAPEVGHLFRKEPPGFYKKALTELIKARQVVQKEMKKIKPQDKLYTILDARQRAIKIITNACYGYTGWIGARWYMKQVAEATTAWGRKTISETLKMVEECSIEVIYGDTDSIFIRYEPEKVKKLIKKIEKSLNLEVRPDKIYKKIYFTEAKKRYAGILEDGSIDIVGLEVVRGDWASISREIQEGVLEIILKEDSIKRAIEFVKTRIKELYEEKIPYKDLIIWKTLTKHIDEYGANAPHVEAAKLLEREGYKLKLGDKIGYVITKGEGKLYKRARPYTMCTIDDIDINYYVNNQILPAALRILQGFGVNEKDLLP